MLSISARKRLRTNALIAALFNAVIALGITTFGNNVFTVNLLYSQLIGMSIWALIDGGRHVLHPAGHISPRQAIALTLVGSAAGYFLGSALGDVLRGFAPLHGWQHVPKHMAGFLLLSLCAGCALVYFFMSREVLMRSKTEREQAQRQATEAQLKLLQSQLDPHMLFNTLANLRALIPQEPDRAVQMLDQLGDFLRATLSASRAQAHSLQAEFDRLRDYLALMQIRLGDRLNFTLNLPASLAQIQVPTLILQSLVENAIVHGIEPKVGGGSLWITASERNGQLVLRVADDGVGFKQNADVSQTEHDLGSGFGLQQVRERLQSWYGNQNTIDFIAVRALNMTASDINDINGLNGIQSTVKEAALATPGCEVTLYLPMQP